MAFEPANPYQGLLASDATGGLGRTQQSALQTAVLTFRAGAYIALGGVRAVR